jgi:hypothetical protein
MAIQTSFAEKVTRFQNSYDRFLAPLGNDGELDLALLDVKNSVRRIALPEHNCILSIIVNGSPAVYLQEKHFGIERERYFAFHCRPSLSRKVFFGERVAKGTTGKPDRQVEVELDHEQAFTDHLQAPAGRFAHGRFLRTF